MSTEALYNALLQALKPYWTEHGYAWNSPSDRAESTTSGVHRQISIYRAGRPRMSLPLVEVELRASVEVAPVTTLLREVFGETGPGAHPPRLVWIDAIPGVKRHRMSSKADAPDVARRMAAGIAACHAVLDPWGTMQSIDTALASAAHYQQPSHYYHQHPLISLCLAHLLGGDVAARAAFLTAHVPPEPWILPDFVRLHAALAARTSAGASP